jgi:hypothetical protein
VLAGIRVEPPGLKLPANRQLPRSSRKKPF